MALNANRYFSNSIIGTPGAGADFNVYDTHALPRYALGLGFKRSDGNCFRYTHFDAATNAGSMVAPTFANSGLTKQAAVGKAPATATAVQNTQILPGAVGSNFIQVTLAGIAANQLEGGYVSVYLGSGKGYQYRIVGNTATGTPIAGDIYIQIYERIVSVISANTSIIVTPSPWNDVVVTSTATNWAFCGVCMATTTTALPFGWVCTNGTATVLEDSSLVTLAGGMIVGLSNVINGAIAPLAQTSTTETQTQKFPAVGYCIQPGGDTNFAVIYLSEIE